MAGEPGREGRRPLDSFCGKEAGGHGQKKGEMDVWGTGNSFKNAEACRALLTKELQPRAPRSYTAHSPAAKLRCPGKGLSWQLWKDPRKK